MQFCRNLISKMVAGKTHVVFEELGLPSELEVGCSIGARPDFLPGAIISYMATNLETNVKVTSFNQSKGDQSIIDVTRANPIWYHRWFSSGVRPTGILKPQSVNVAILFNADQ